ncbi:hypothetical protein NTG1052_940020 [Candidatus Nitrotoga sp. 1052]|nr:hypothetical protein NTG1052_940020 [Candidatus Nitrotoga sp. 1052]
METGDARLSASVKILSLNMFEELFDQVINADNKPRKFKFRGLATDSRLEMYSMQYEWGNRLPWKNFKISREYGG